MNTVKPDANYMQRVLDSMDPDDPARTEIEDFLEEQRKPRWRIKPYKRNLLGELLYVAISPLNTPARSYPFLSIPDAMKEIRKRFDQNA